MELLRDPKPVAGVASVDGDQLPPLMSMIVEGLPPLQQSQYVHEAEKASKQYMERNGSIHSFHAYCRAGLSFASYAHSGVISVDRLVAISVEYAIAFLLDDIFFDDADNADEALLDQYGIERTARESPQKMQAYFNHLISLFAQQQPPSNPATLIESMVRESGRVLLAMSSPEWFNEYVERLDEHYRLSTSSHADIVSGHKPWFQDVEAYNVMRAGDVGGKFIQLLAEFASNTYIPSALRSDPFMHKVTTAASIHLGLSNDIVSYHKESSLEGNPRNLITVLMECEGRSFLHTVPRALELTNTYARTIVDLESEAWNPAFQNHLQDIKVLVAGNVYFSCLDPRYRQSNSVFPELRDTTASWKILPRSEVAVA